MGVSGGRALAPLVLAAIAVATGATAPSSAASASGSEAAGASLTVGTSKYGVILEDGRGYALYTFSHDPRAHATCYGTCARRWPPLVVRVRPAARKGAKASLVGVTRRRDGKLQATYSGRPLYYYIGDDAPGIVLCQNVAEFGGLWRVVRSTGTPVR